MVKFVFARATFESGREGCTLLLVAAHGQIACAAPEKELKPTGLDIMKKLLTGFLAATALTLSGFAAVAEGEPAVQFDLGGKFDKSFNESAYNGAEKWKAESGKTYLEFEIQNADQREQGLRKLAESGANPVVAVGFSNADAITKLADEFPKTNFVIVDMVVDKPNVRSVVYQEQEGSYLVGIMAAMASKTGKPKPGFMRREDIYDLKLDADLVVLSACQTALGKDVRGEGLMLGLKCRATNTDVVNAGYDAGVLTVAAADNVIRLLPALNIPDDDIREALSRLDQAAANTPKTA